MKVVLAEGSKGSQVKVVAIAFLGMVKDRIGFFGSVRHESVPSAGTRTVNTRFSPGRSGVCFNRLRNHDLY
jgi:hypothetical protein